ncbi:MAG: hypothetical protein PSN04_04085 [Methyloprofundus sp.]|nr:hypothetical protein [Methyloprofundus sp.]
MKATKISARLICGPPDPKPKVLIMSEIFSVARLTESDVSNSLDI